MTTWYQLFRDLDADLVRLPQGRPEWLRDAETSGILPSRLLQDLRHGELPHLLAIESAINRCTTDGDWPSDMEPEVVFHLRCRIETVAYFLNQHCLSEDAPTIFPSPTESPRTVFRWLLVDWWQAHGQHQMVQNILCAPEYSEDDDATE